jgi:hypothetical protein
METFSLLQVSLEQTIDLESLEDASAAAPSIARTDCAFIHRDLFGIVVSGLERDEAIAFQAELGNRDFPTELVADRELPVLHEGFRIQRIECGDEVLVLTDSMGRVRTRPIAELVFIAAGFLKQIEIKTEWHQRLDFGGGRRGVPQVVNERESREESELLFRLDFFFWSEPNRLHAVLAENTAIFHQGQPLRLRNDHALDELMAAMANLVPQDRLSSGLRTPATGRFYPNLHGYEEEIRWHFYRLTPRA